MGGPELVLDTPTPTKGPAVAKQETEVISLPGQYLNEAERPKGIAELRVKHQEEFASPKVKKTQTNPPEESPSNPTPKTDQPFTSQQASDLTTQILGVVSDRDLHNPGKTDLTEYARVANSKKFQEALKQTDSKGVTLGKHLQTLLDPDTQLQESVIDAYKDRYPHHTKEMIKAEIVKSILEKVDTGMAIDQGVRNTCAIAAVEMQACNLELAETAAAAVNLVTKGHHELAGGAELGLTKEESTLTLPANALGIDKKKGIYPARGILDQVLQEAGSNWLASLTAKGNYNPETTSWNSGSMELSGFFAPQANLYLEALTGRSFKHVSTEDNPEAVNKVTGALADIANPKDPSSIDFTKAIPVHLRWSDQGDHARHALNAVGIIEKDGKKFVVLANSHYEQGFGPECVEELLHNNKGEIHQRLETMPLDEFEARLCDAHLLNPEGTELTSNLEDIKSFVAEQTASIYVRITGKEPDKTKKDPPIFYRLNIPVDYNPDETANTVIEPRRDLEEKEPTSHTREGFDHKRAALLKQQQEEAEERSNKNNTASHHQPTRKDTTDGLRPFNFLGNLNRQNKKASSEPSQKQKVGGPKDE